MADEVTRDQAAASTEPTRLEDAQALQAAAEHIESRYPGMAALMRRCATRLYVFDAATLPCGHPKSDETSADGYTFCAVCAVGGPEPDQEARSAAQGHWLAVEFELRRVLDPEEAADAALTLKEAGFTVTAPEHLRAAALVQEGATDA